MLTSNVLKVLKQDDNIEEDISTLTERQSLTQEKEPEVPTYTVDYAKRLRVWKALETNLKRVIMALPSEEQATKEYKRMAPSEKYSNAMLRSLLNLLRGRRTIQDEVLPIAGASGGGQEEREAIAQMENRFRDMLNQEIEGMVVLSEEEGHLASLHETIYKSEPNFLSEKKRGRKKQEIAQIQELLSRGRTSKETPQTFVSSSDVAASVTHETEKIESQIKALEERIDELHDVGVDEILETLKAKQIEAVENMSNWLATLNSKLKEIEKEQQFLEKNLEGRKKEDPKIPEIKALLADLDSAYSQTKKNILQASDSLEAWKGQGKTLAMKANVHLNKLLARQEDAIDSLKERLEWVGTNFGMDSTLITHLGKPIENKQSQQRLAQLKSEFTKTYRDLNAFVNRENDEFKGFIEALEGKTRSIVVEMGGETFTSEVELSKFFDIEEALAVQPSLSKKDRRTIKNLMKRLTRIKKDMLSLS